MNGLTEEYPLLVHNVMFETAVKLVNSIYLVVVGTLQEDWSLLTGMRCYWIFFSTQSSLFQLKEDWDFCQKGFSLAG